MSNTASIFVNPAFVNFLDWEAKSRDTIDFKKVYVDMAGDLLAGLLLSQIVYWNLPSKKGENRLTVERDGFFWLAKSRTAWWEEIRMSPREVDRSLEILRKSGLIETELWHYHDKKTTHIRISPEGFMDAVYAASKGDKCRDKRKFTRPQKLDPTLKSLNREILPNDEIGTAISLNSDLHIPKQGNANDEIGICYISENTPKITLKEHTQRISPLPPAGGTPPAAAARAPEVKTSFSFQEPEKKMPIDWDSLGEKQQPFMLLAEKEVLDTYRALGKTPPYVVIVNRAKTLYNVSRAAAEKGEGVI